AWTSFLFFDAGPQAGGGGPGARGGPRRAPPAAGHRYRLDLDPRRPAPHAQGARHGFFRHRRGPGRSAVRGGSRPHRAGRRAAPHGGRRRRGVFVEYVAARLGREVVDRLIEPLLGGVYAGDAYRISMRSAVPQLFQVARTHTSLTEGVREIQARMVANQQTGPVFMGLEGGVGTLPLAVADAVRARGGEIVTGAPVSELRREPSGGWKVVTADRVLHADAVIVAVPAPAAAGLLRAEAPEAATELDTVEYASMALVTLAYRRSDTDLPAGSGFLVPPVDGRTIKASTFASQKWGWIAEENPELVVLRTSVGRFGETEILERDDTALVDVSRHDLREATGLDAAPLETRVTRWTDGLPQYPVGHHTRVARIREHVAKLPGLAVCGAQYDGVGIPACIASAHAAVDQIQGDLTAVRELTANPVQSLHGGAGE
ncbi:LOW QUALITY PROTEIN: protoporphyrinogen oxidase, partial [Streptomyces sviceus ATCC 29083]